MSGRGRASGRGRVDWVAGLPLVTALHVLALGQGCADPEGRYDDFIERTADARGGGGSADGGGPVAGERFDFGGDYVLALAVTLSPDTPLLLSLEVDVAADLETFDLVLQPLSTQADPDPLALVGDPFELRDVPYAIDGSFETPRSSVTIPGRANPISGSQIVAQVSLVGSARQGAGERPRLLCGRVSGEVSDPLMLDLAGSTFGAVDADAVETRGLLSSCPR